MQNNRQVRSHEASKQSEAAGQLISGTIEGMNTKGIWTSEFWLTALLIVATFVLLLTGKISVDDIVDLWPLFGMSGAYSLSRGVTKMLG